VTIRFFQQTITLLASAGVTHGVLGAIEVASPGGAAPPLHVHHREDEVFYVLEGDYSIFVGDDVIPGRPGTWVWGPRDVPHGYQVHSPVGRHLSLTVPGGFEAFFEEVEHLATPSTDPRDALGDLRAVAAGYGVELLGPPRAPA
jgi:quercetin dioxygenase-like cupin family protein